LYTEGMMALNSATKNVEYISVDRLIKQPPMDTNYISIRDYIAEKTAGSIYSKNKITPEQLASELEKDCNKALSIVRNINMQKNKALGYEVADIKTWSYLGLHFSEKIKAGLALQKYRTQGGADNKQAAILHLKKSLSHWDSVIEITTPLYNEMPLVHLSQQGGKETPENFYKTFHWKNLRPDVMRDVQMVEAEK